MRRRRLPRIVRIPTWVPPGAAAEMLFAQVMAWSTLECLAADILAIGPTVRIPTWVPPAVAAEILFVHVLAWTLP